jgi:hypothetical protein
MMTRRAIMTMTAGAAGRLAAVAAAAAIALACLMVWHAASDAALVLVKTSEFGCSVTT